MSLELKQIITQIVAFLIMLWILKRYLWKPLLSLMQERTEKIQAEFKKIEEKDLEADQVKLEYQKKIEESNLEKRQIIQNAVKEAKRIGQQIEEDAQNKAKEVLLKAQEQASREISILKKEYEKEMVNNTVGTIEKLIKKHLTEEDKEHYTKELMEQGPL